MIFTLIKKELMFLLKNPVGYVFSGLLLVVVNWMYFYDFFISGQADLIPFWSTLIFLFSIFIPAISMGTLAEEKKNGHWELLLSLPVSETGVVLGKFIGNLMYILMTIVLALPTIVVVYSLGKFDVGILLAQIFGVIMLGGCYLSLGVWLSSMTNQPMVAFLITAVLLIVNNIMGQASVLSRVPNLVQNILMQISLSNRLENFMSGLIKTGDVIFFGSWIAIFLTLAVMSLKGRDK
jgi:ABC-2 type transport system permease protein